MCRQEQNRFLVTAALGGGSSPALLAPRAAVGGNERAFFFRAQDYTAARVQELLGVAPPGRPAAGPTTTQPGMPGAPGVAPGAMGGDSRTPALGRFVQVRTAETPERSRSVPLSHHVVAPRSRCPSARSRSSPSSKTSSTTRGRHRPTNASRVVVAQRSLSRSVCSSRRSRARCARANLEPRNCET